MDLDWTAHLESPGVRVSKGYSSNFGMVWARASTGLQGNCPPGWHDPICLFVPKHFQLIDLHRLVLFHKTMERSFALPRRSGLRRLPSGYREHDGYDWLQGMIRFFWTYREFPFQSPKPHSQSLDSKRSAWAMTCRISAEPLHHLGNVAILDRSFWASCESYPFTYFSSTFCLLC